MNEVTFSELSLESNSYYALPLQIIYIRLTKSMLCFLNRLLTNPKLQGIRYFSATKFTPPDTKQFDSNELQYLVEFIKSSKKLAVITGAGIRYPPSTSNLKVLNLVYQIIVLPMEVTVKDTNQLLTQNL